MAHFRAIAAVREYRAHIDYVTNLRSAIRVGIAHDLRELEKISDAPKKKEARAKLKEKRAQMVANLEKQFEKLEALHKKTVALMESINEEPRYLITINRGVSVGIPPV